MLLEDPQRADDQGSDASPLTRLALRILQ